jgi:hypothetical protein
MSLRASSLRRERISPQASIARSSRRSSPSKELRRKLLSLPVSRRRRTKILTSLRKISSLVSTRRELESVWAKTVWMTLTRLKWSSNPPRNQPLL